MKKIIGYAFALVLTSAIISCNKNNNTVTTPAYQPAALEVPEINAFIEAEGLSMTMSPDSIWYHISNYGDTLNGRLTQDSATAVITYTCQMLDGTVVAQTTEGSNSILDYITGAVSNDVNNVIYSSMSYFLVPGSGPQNLLVGKGAIFSFIMPSMYQYGSTAVQINGITIPPNSPLYYTVQFVNKQPS